MSTLTPAETGPDPLLSAAAAGDREAFDALATPHLRAIHLHCYRMLGSYHDAQEASQETLLRAWQALSTYQGRAPLLHWLYRIATTTCLKALARRARQPVAMAELTDLEPYPDRLLDEPAAAGDPAAQITGRESVALLDLSVAAVNSALQRARTTLRTLDTRSPARLLDTEEQQLVNHFMQAWRRNDIPALAALLRDDVILRMPPEPIEFHTRAVVAEFLATVPGDGHLDRILLRATTANGQPALAAYETQVDGQATAYGLMVLTTAEGGIATITGFRDPALFDAFALPATLR